MGCLQFGDLGNKAATNILVRVFGGTDTHSLVSGGWSGISGY